MHPIYCKICDNIKCKYITIFVFGEPFIFLSAFFSKKGKLLTCHHGGRAYEKNLLYLHAGAGFLCIFFFLTANCLYLMRVNSLCALARLLDIFKRRLPMGVR